MREQMRTQKTKLDQNDRWRELFFSLPLSFFSTSTRRPSLFFFPWQKTKNKQKKDLLLQKAPSLVLLAQAQLADAAREVCQAQDRARGDNRSRVRRFCFFVFFLFSLFAFFFLLLDIILLFCSLCCERKLILPNPLLTDTSPSS